MGLIQRLPADRPKAARPPTSVLTSEFLFNVSFQAAYWLGLSRLCVDAGGHSDKSIELLVKV